MVLQTKGIVQLGEDLNLAPIGEDIDAIALPVSVPQDEPVLLESVELPGSAYIIPAVCDCDAGDDIYNIQQPVPAIVVFTRDGNGDVTLITTTNAYGVKTTTFTYVAGEVDYLDINNYGEESRRVTFTRVAGEVTQITTIET
ncbi:MAG: hypothetical protein ACTSQF_01860 [Candidatus Heimdallarchaeaceae archaeon]